MPNKKKIWWKVSQHALKIITVMRKVDKREFPGEILRVIFQPLDSREILSRLPGK